MLAMWAQPMAAGVRDEALIGASSALPLHHLALRRTTATQGGKCLQVFGLQSWCVMSDEFAGETFNDLRQSSHLTPRQITAKPSIKVLIWVIAWRCVCSVKWV